MVDDLEHRVEELRREQLPNLLSEVTRLAELVSHELSDDEKALAEAEVAFKRDFGVIQRLNPFGKRTREKAWKRTVGRHQREVLGDRTLHDRLFQLLTIVSGAAQPIEWRQHSGAIAAVYHGMTGRVEWRTSNTGGVFGIYNPVQREAEWRESEGAIFGVFNEHTNEVEWREHAGGGICGVYNPKSQSVQWRQEDGAGVFGVYLPETQSVRWRSVPNASAVAGWHRGLQRWEWQDHRGGGLACIYHDGVTFRTNSAWCPPAPA